MKSPPIILFGCDLSPEKSHSEIMFLNPNLRMVLWSVKNIFEILDLEVSLHARNVLTVTHQPESQTRASCYVPLSGSQFLGMPPNNP